VQLYNLILTAEKTNIKTKMHIFCKFRQVKIKVKSKWFLEVKYH